MATEVLIKNGTPIVWANSGEYGDSPYTRTHQIDLGGLANNAMRQGAKADFGATRARDWAIFLGIELDVDLSAAGAVYLYFSSSPSATAGTGNKGGASGVDEAYTDGVNSPKENLDPVGTLHLPATCDDDILYSARIGIYTPVERYASPVLLNASGQAFEATADLIYIAAIPIIDEIQNT